MVPEITQKALALAGKKAHFLIIPLASMRSDAGLNSQQFWRAAGAESVEVMRPHDKVGALALIKQADFIWMSGGSQCRLMDILKQDGVINAIRERFRQGATIGGTSAGAAVMSLEMLTGETSAFQVTSATGKMVEGLGLWPDVIVDQHYLKRQRRRRLFNAVMTHPDKVGIGIDESTAAFVTGRTFEVVGKSSVEVIDARHQRRSAAKDGDLNAIGDDSPLPIELRSGMRFDLDKGLLAGDKESPSLVNTAMAGKTPHSNRKEHRNTNP